MTGGITAAAASGSGIGNYAITYNPGDVTITPAPLSITPNSTSKTYGQLVTFTGTEFTDTGLQNGETVGSVTLTSPGTPTSAGVTGSPYTITGTSATGGTFTPSNYTITYNTGLLTVNPATLTVAANPKTKVYGTNDPTLTFTTGPFQNGDPTSTLTGTLTRNPGQTVAGGPYTINEGTLTAGPNYTIVYTPSTLTITPAPLTITANSTSKVYGTGLTFNGTEFTDSGLVGGDTVGTVTLTSAGTPANAGVAGSPYGITPSAATGGTFTPSNYTISYVPGALTVTPLPIDVVGTRVYDGQPDVTGTILTPTNLVPGDSVSITGTGTLGGKDVGVQTITGPGTLTLIGTSAGNYTTNGGTSAVTITPFPVILLGTRVYDGLKDGNAGILAVTNAFPGDTVSVASGTSTIASKNVGAETITNFGTLVLGNNTAGDYTLVGASGLVNVTPLSLTVTAVPTTKTYDGTTTSTGTPIITSGMLVTTDTGSFIQQYGTKNAGTGLTLTPSGFVTDGNGGNNYIVTYVPVTTGVINPLAVVLLGTRLYDGTTNAIVTTSNIVITNLIPGDSVTLGGAGSVISPAIGSETITDFTGYSLAGTVAGNYTLIGATGIVNITPAMQITLTIIPGTETASGNGTTSATPGATTAYNGGLLTLTPQQNGVVTGTIATINGSDYHPDSQLGCTIGSAGCLQNGVAPSTTSAPQ